MLTFKPVVGNSWEEVMEDAPERTKIACNNKVKEAKRKHATRK